MKDKKNPLIFENLKGFFKRLVGQDQLLSQLTSIKAGQDYMTSQFDSILRGLAITINQQNKILERIDDIEAQILELKRGK